MKIHNFIEDGLSGPLIELMYTPIPVEAEFDGLTVGFETIHHMAMNRPVSVRRNPLELGRADT